MAQIIWTEPALNDLDEIAEYIALENFEAAQIVVRSVFQKVERLENHPKSGKKPVELPRKTIYRELVANPCRIFYRQEGAKILIIYVMRSERVLRTFLLEDRGKIRS